MPLKEMSLADQVRDLESKCQNALDVAGEMLATLRLNQEVLCPGNHDAAQTFDELIGRWEKRIGLGSGWHHQAKTADKPCVIINKDDGSVIVRGKDLAG